MEHPADGDGEERASPRRAPAGGIATLEKIARRAASEAATEVLLVTMPFAPLLHPSLALSLLRAALPDAVRSRVLYLNLPFAAALGAERYSWIANGYPSTTAFVGEWVFRRALFGAAGDDPERFLAEIVRRESALGPATPEMEAGILAARDAAEPFLDACVAAVLAHRPRIVGMTSVFQQHLASLALARRLKAADPRLFIVLGGANCEGVMGREAMRRFPDLDAVVSGEGDAVFPQLVERLLDGGSPVGLPGVVWRGPDGEPAWTAEVSRPIRDLDALPYPDFDDFLAAWEATPFAAELTPQLLFETSRGCWWGEKQHCTFCGLNGSNMAYRSKSPERALAELAAITGRAPGRPVMVVDNILDMGYFQSLLPALAAAELELELFYEVKANLRKDQVWMLRRAGITDIQPGIESLSDAVLRRMAKGVTALQNIQLLKWCAEAGVHPHWNILWGFPGEPPEEYERMAELLPSLVHLPPPRLATPIRIDRFSPNFDRAAALGFADVEPCPAYRHLYPLPAPAIANLAYYFTYGYREPQPVDAYTRPLAAAVDAWRRDHRSGSLFFVDRGERLLLWDRRPVARRPLAVLTGRQRRLYLAADGVTTLGRLARRASRDEGREVAVAAVEETLGPLIEGRWMVRDGDRVLALAVAGGTEDD